MAPRLVDLRPVGPGGGPVRVGPLRSRRVRERLVRLLAETPLGSMATVTPGGLAHVHTAYFAVSPDLDVVFLSDSRSRHARNLRSNRSFAMTVFPSALTWGGSDRGAQLFGTARVTRGADADRAEETYARRFRDYRAWRAGLNPNDPARGWRLYRFRPRRVKVFDEDAFGSGVFVLAHVRRRGRQTRRSARSSRRS